MEKIYTADELQLLASTLPGRLTRARENARAAEQPERARKAFVRALQVAIEHFPLLYDIEVSSPANDRTAIEISEEKVDALAVDIFRIVTLAARLYLASGHSQSLNIWRMFHFVQVRGEIEKGREKIEEQIWKAATIAIAVIISSITNANWQCLDCRESHGDLFHGLSSTYGQDYHKHHMRHSGSFTLHLPDRVSAKHSAVIAQTPSAAQIAAWLPIVDGEQNESDSD